MEDWKTQLLKEAETVIKHGFGEITITAEEIHGQKVKVIIKAGRSFVFFMFKDRKFANDDII